MHNDSVYPRNGRAYIPTVPKKQLERDEKTEAEVLNELPLINKLVKRLDEKIAFYSSVSSIPDEVQTKPDEFMHVITANKLTVKNLKAERDYIVSRVLQTKG